MPKPADFYTKVPHRIPTREEYEKKKENPIYQKPKSQRENAFDFAMELVASTNFLVLMNDLPSPHFLGRENEVNAVIESLMKKRMRNCVLIGEAGVGKTEIAREAISRTKNEFFLKLDTASLHSGCTLMGQFEAKLTDILVPISLFNQKSKIRVSLFIDEIHTLWNLGYNEYTGSVSAGNILKPYLSDGTITIIGATTPKEYKKSINGDMALVRRVTPIFVNPLPDEAIRAILKGFCGNELSDPIIDKCLEASKGIKYLSNPDCAIEIADRLMAKAIRKNKIADEQDLAEVMASMETSLYSGE